MQRLAKVALVIALAATVFVAGGIGAFRSLRSEASDGAVNTATTVAAGDLLAPTAGAGQGLGATIESLQQRLAEAPQDWRSFATLGLAYVQQARVTSDPSFYPKAQGVLRTSMRLQPQDNEGALVGLAALASARHDFSAALRYGRQARHVDPYDGNVYGVIGDAQLELGHYDDAFATFQTMVDTLPSLSSYARVSYARELLGDVDGAIRSMEAARDVAGSPADVAWASFQLGELAFNSGRLDRAAREYERGLSADDSFVPNLAGTAKVAWARGEVDLAIERYSEVVQRYPSPEYVIALGDLYASVGRDEDAQRQVDLVRAEAKLFAANGVDTDLELALFDADHGDPHAALSAARAEWQRRQSIHVADALAWALHMNGDDIQAARYAERALALGTPNALFLFHAGAIQASLGHDDAARRLLQEALDTNPHFSIQHAPEAQVLLDDLGLDDLGREDLEVAL